jgi:hypothetical protein
MSKRDQNRHSTRSFRRPRGLRNLTIALISLLAVDVAIALTVLGGV